jgi:hypothetical protein
MRVAATVPVESVLPVAVAHSPTLSAALVAATVSVYVVAGVTVTVSVVMLGDAVAGEVLALAPKLRATARTVMLDPSTAVTVPSTMSLRPLRPAAPLGRAPVGKEPDGRSDRAPEGDVRPLPPPNPPRTPSAVQVPLVGLLITTAVAVIAVTGAADAPLAAPTAGVAVASTHSPTVTAASVSFSLAVMAVAAVKSTVT